MNDWGAELHGLPRNANLVGLTDRNNRESRCTGMIGLLKIDKKLLGGISDFMHCVL